MDSDLDDEEEENETSLSNELRKDIFVEDKIFFYVVFVVDKVILREVEEMEEKVFIVSL